MYQLGVRSFAVFFDDISGEGTNPQKQAELLNYIDEKFAQVKPDINQLVMCPTEYNKSWSNPNGNYLTTLGDKLNPSIQIMWTGDRVISDLPVTAFRGLTNESSVRLISGELPGVRLCARSSASRSCVWQRYYDCQRDVGLRNQSDGTCRIVKDSDL